MNLRRNFLKEFPKEAQEKFWEKTQEGLSGRNPVAISRIICESILEGRKYPWRNSGEAISGYIPKRISKEILKKIFGDISKRNPERINQGTPGELRRNPERTFRTNPWKKIGKNKKEFWNESLKQSKWKCLMESLKESRSNLWKNLKTSRFEYPKEIVEESQEIILKESWRNPENNSLKNPDEISERNPAGIPRELLERTPEWILGSISKKSLRKNQSNPWKNVGIKERINKKPPKESRRVTFKEPLKESREVSLEKNLKESMK